MRKPGRAVFLALGAIAFTYAFFAGLRTVADHDLGWQLATGRWVIAHHRVPSVDVFSYTAAGQPWIYPVGSGVLFYLAYLIGGYAVLSWIGAIACAGTVLLLLRKNSAIGAVLAFLAVPAIATRTMPRAEMFSVVLFAAFVSLLWENHRFGHARLWLLPALMAGWVNLHLGFIAGLALAGAYVGVELVEAALHSGERAAAIERLRRAWVWLALVPLATLGNPWGWGIYRAILAQQRATAEHESLIAEWMHVPMSWAAITSSLSLRETQLSFYLLLGLGVAAAGLALWRARWGAALLLIPAIYVGATYARMGFLFATVTVIVGGTVLSDAARPLESRLGRLSPALAWASVMLVAALGSIRCYDLATNRFYFAGAGDNVFGAGLSWWFPERAAEFIEQHNLPGEVFNSYNEGGYVTWKLGPERRDTIDGRALPFGALQIERNNKLLMSSPDSALWNEEAGRYGIRTILLPLGRINAIESTQPKAFCESTGWQPVYLDEVSVVLVRRTPETEELRRRFAVNCATAPLPAQPPRGSRADQANAWANAADLLSALDRNQEALGAVDHALAIFKDSGILHGIRATALSALGREDDSEQEYLRAIELIPSEGAWAALAESYRKSGRMLDALDAGRRAVALSPRPYRMLVRLAYVYLSLKEPEDALKMVDEAVSAAPANLADHGNFDFMAAQARSAAWDELHEPSRAIEFQEQAARIKPDSPEAWRRLTELYTRAGRAEDAARAEKRAAEAAGSSP